MPSVHQSNPAAAQAALFAFVGSGSRVIPATGRGTFFFVPPPRTDDATTSDVRCVGLEISRSFTITEAQVTENVLQYGLRDAEGNVMWSGMGHDRADGLLRVMLAIWLKSRRSPTTRPAARTTLLVPLSDVQRPRGIDYEQIRPHWFVKKATGGNEALDQSQTNHEDRWGGHVPTPHLRKRSLDAIQCNSLRVLSTRLSAFAGRIAYRGGLWSRVSGVRVPSLTPIDQALTCTNAKRARIHDLRHTHVSWLIAQGVFAGISRLLHLGHRLKRESWSLQYPNLRGGGPRHTSLPTSCVRLRPLLKLRGTLPPPRT
jgi:hypothetical protein